MLAGEELLQHANTIALDLLRVVVRVWVRARARVGKYGSRFGLGLGSGSGCQGQASALGW